MGERGNKFVDPLSDLPCQIYDIGNHSASRRSSSCAQPVIKVGPHKVAFQIYGIIDAVNAGHDMVEGNHTWMHPCRNIALPIPGDSQEFYAITEFTRKADVFRGQFFYPLPVDSFEGYGDAEGNGDEDGQLMGRISTIHIQGGRVLRVPKSYGLLYGFIIWEFPLRHPC